MHQIEIAQNRQREQSSRRQKRTIGQKGNGNTARSNQNFVGESKGTRN